MLQQITSFFMTAFQPGVGWNIVLISIALGLTFGAIWLIAYQPSLRNKASFLLVAGVSALFTWSAISFIQLPLQSFWVQGLLQFWDESTVAQWWLLAGIPFVLISGLVQEGAKMVPLVFYKSKNHGTFDTINGLITGAIAGAGFGVFEAIWVNNKTFASGFSWQILQTQGLGLMLPFVERFFAVGFHIAISALAGYGLAKVKGRRFYLLAAFLHGATNYSVVLAQMGTSTDVIEACLATCSVLVTAVVLWLRWRKTSHQNVVAETRVGSYV
jgi:RsiW-degrading membrane proteinase PrsW (M82 family)